MLRSWNSVRTAVIFPDAAWLYERPRFGGGAGQILQRVRTTTGSVAPVSAWRDVSKGQATRRIDAVFGSRWFRFGVLPWELQSGRDDDDRRAALVLLDGVDAIRDAIALSPARVALAPARFGRSRFFVAADPAMAAGFAADPAHAPRTWQPWASAALAASGPTGEQEVVAVIEPGLVTFLSCVQGWPEQVTVKRWPPEDVSALVGLLQTEQVRRDTRVRVVDAAVPTVVRRGLAAAGLVSSPLRHDRHGIGLLGDRA